MYNFEQVGLQNLVVHHVGNKLKDEGVKMSSTCIDIEEDFIRNLLLQYFLSSFKEEQFFRFDLELEEGENKVFSSAKNIFADPEKFYEESIALADLLYENSTHQMIKSGEFYMVYFQDCVVDGEFADGIGIFKSENKDTYLKVYQKNRNFEIGYDAGININKLDKGCLILNTEEEDGFKVCVIDTVTKTSEVANFWKKDFLHLKEKEDSYYHTHHYLNMCKGFVDNVLEEDEAMPRTEKIDVLNNTVNYFKEKELFDQSEFEENVMKEPQIIDAFNKYKDLYYEENELQAGMGEFDISEGAIKKNQKYFKSVLKLDKNFHVYVHGNRDMIEKGFDSSRGLNYYKLFYSKES
jgi:hypothetical protein